jgi:hypothetical protein
MDILLGTALVAVWITISVVGLKRAYGPRGASPRKPRLEARRCGWMRSQDIDVSDPGA